MRKAFLVSCLVIGASLYGMGQAPAADQAAAADSVYQKKDWAKSEPLYQQLSEAQPDNARNWYRLAVSLQGNGKHQQAMDALQKAKDKGTPPTFIAYEMAVIYVSMGDTDHAMQQLAEAVKQGYAQPDQMNADPALQSVRNDARFAPLLEQVKHNQTPCTYTAENRQFDFWVGDWDVVTTKGSTPAGISHIERAIGDCVIWENWTSLGGGGYGKSYNTYNSSMKRWEQFWVDSVGGMVHFYGGLKGDVMDFYTDETPQPNGPPVKRHLQFFNLSANQVRQFSQMTTDGGKTWTPEYDFIYNRKQQ